MELCGALQEAMVAALREPGILPDRCDSVRLLETHISYVLLTGAHAYKIKKAVKLGFLDFTTLAARRFYCDEELRLNRRLAPELYLDVVPITGSVEAPQLGGAGAILDYAVKMREFPQAALMANVLAHGGVTNDHVDRFASAVAQFHGEAATAMQEDPFGRPEDVLEIALANFAELRPLVTAAADRLALERLETWTRREHATRRTTIVLRRQRGFVRECHGDLHLGNVALIEDVPTIFDCIEFNERMRWIDVISEVAFTAMDFDYRGKRAYGQRFLNAYLETTGDYDGVALLRFYGLYRAMVRAKVAFLRAAQLSANADRVAVERDYRDHLQQALGYASKTTPAIIVMHGFAGSGKTTASQALLERIGAIRVRTDVERKRLHNLHAMERSHSGIETDLYADDATRKTYDRLRALARTVAESGFPAIVDGAFLQRWQRDWFRELAGELSAPFIIVSVGAPETTLRARVATRASAGSDASEAGVAVLEHQLRTHEPLGADEHSDVLFFDGELSDPTAHPADAWRALDDRLHAAAAAA
jgi:uncharacterized protein